MLYEVITSLLEAVLAKGDRKLCDVIYKAWKKGSNLDSWDEYFKFNLWEEAFAECSVDTAFYANRKRNFDEVLPWGHLDYMVTHDFFV